MRMIKKSPKIHDTTANRVYTPQVGIDQEN